MSGNRASRVRWLLVFWLFVLSGISYLDRVNIAIAGSSLAEEYHLSQVRLGWVFTAFLLGYALFQTPGDGWWTGTGRGECLRVALCGGDLHGADGFVADKSLGRRVFFILVRFLLGAEKRLFIPLRTSSCRNGSLRKNEAKRMD